MNPSLGIRQLRHAANNLSSEYDSFDSVERRAVMVIHSLSNRLQHGRSYDPQLKALMDDLSDALTREGPHPE